MPPLKRAAAAVALANRRFGPFGRRFVDKLAKCMVRRRLYRRRLTARSSLTHIP